MRAFILLFLFGLFGLGCTDPAGRFATYEGQFHTGYPWYFVPKQYPQERWMTSFSQDEAWRRAYASVIQKDRQPQTRALIRQDSLRAYQDPMLLGFSGGVLEVRFTGTPGRKYPEGIGTKNCCDRVMDVQHYQLLRIIYPPNSPKP